MTATRSRQTVVGEEEFEERVRILRRLRHMLVQQRDRLRSYLEALEQEGDSIREGDVDQFERHVELEQSIAREIFEFRKAIDPLEALYRATSPTQDREIPRLRAHLEKLQEDVLKRNGENRALLHMRVEDLRSQVESLRAPTKQRTALRPGADAFRKQRAGAMVSTGSVVDIST